MNSLPGIPVWSLGVDSPSRPALNGDTAVDVTIVGAGYSGLWLAYWLACRRPDFEILVVERDHVGFGASGRNGGWASALLPVSLTSLSRVLGEESTIRLQAEMIDAVREIGLVCSSESIDCDYQLGGSISLVRNDTQRTRAVADVEDYSRFGFADHVRMLDRRDTRQRIAFDGESVFRPDCAAIHPRRLVDGLARAVERRGVRVVERTTVVDVEPGVVVTDRGPVRSRWIVDCREAFAAPTSRRRVVPIQSLMIATEPLSDEVWNAIGLANRETLTDHRHQLIYGQRTADGRLAFGGRGVGYRFGSRIRPSDGVHPRVHADLRRSLVELFPVLLDHEITHRWGGPLAAPRDWTWTVTLDPSSGLGVMGGYVGDGVTSTFLAARAMARAIDEGASDFPLFGHRSPRWEPEPLRWIGINALNRWAAFLDDRENRGRNADRSRRIFDRLLGRRA